MRLRSRNGMASKSASRARRSALVASTSPRRPRMNAGASVRASSMACTDGRMRWTPERYTVAAGDAIPAGICAKDAIITELTGTTTKGKDHALAAKELRQALGQWSDAAAAEKGMRELVSSKADVEFGVTLVSAVKAEALVRRARSLVELAVRIVRLNG